MGSLMLQRMSAGSSCAPLPHNAERASHILLRSDFNRDSSCAYLALLDQSSCMVNGRLNALLRSVPKLV